MGREERNLTTNVIGPDGAPLTLANLPPADTRRWVARRKAEVVAAVNGGLLGLKEACDRYGLTVEEFLSWEDALLRYGVNGLKVTHAQERRPFSRQAATQVRSRARAGFTCALTH